MELPQIFLSPREPFFHFSRETIIPSVISSSEKMNSHSFYLLVSLTLTANKQVRIQKLKSSRCGPLLRLLCHYCAAEKQVIPRGCIVFRWLFGYAFTQTLCLYNYAFRRQNCTCPKQLPFLCPRYSVLWQIKKIFQSSLYKCPQLVGTNQFVSTVIWRIVNLGKPR